jgi:hypothetical protein
MEANCSGKNSPLRKEVVGPIPEAAISKKH